MLQRVTRWIRGEEPSQDDHPVCGDHDVPMELFKKVGKPARFTDQQTEVYTMIYRCPVPGCAESAERRVVRNQIPVPGEITERPAWARRDRRSM